MHKLILGVIPARGGSKSIPRKNIKTICGKPLIQYIFEASQQSRYITRLILSTEDEEIATVGKSIGMEVPFERPKELAKDDVPEIYVIKHALRVFDEVGFKADAVILLHLTNPFTRTQTIDKAIELWLDTGCDSVTTVAEVTRGHPYITKRLKTGNIIEDFCIIPEGTQMHVRQARERAYYLTGAVYLRSRSIIEAKNMDSHYLGKDSRAIVVDEIEAIDINTLFDFELAHWLMTNRIEDKL